MGERVVATKDITDEQVCQAFHQARECHFAHWPYEFLEHWTRQPFKVCWSAILRAYRHGLLECGVSERTGWLTEAGRALIAKRVEPATPAT